MAYNYEWPYVDPNRHNSDWELNKVKELDARVTAAEQEIADFKTTIKSDWADYQDKINGQIDDFTGGMISQWNDYKQEMNQSWTTYQNNLNASWAAYQTNLNADWDAYKTQMGTDWADYQQSINAQWAQFKADTDADITAWETTTSANLNKLIDDYKALINGEWAQYKTDTDADIAAFKSSINVSLSGMDGRITAMQTAITTLQSDWATFQTTIQGDITTFENSVNSALSSMRTDMADFESDINAKISTQNAQIASMQTAVNDIPTTVNTAVDDRINSLTPPYSVVGIMWRNYHNYFSRYYSGITGATLIICGSVAESAIDGVIAQTGITYSQRYTVSDYADLRNRVQDTAFKIIMIGDGFTGSTSGDGLSEIKLYGPTIVIRVISDSGTSYAGAAHALLALHTATAFYTYQDHNLYPPRTELFAAGDLSISVCPGMSYARIYGNFSGNKVVLGFPVGRTTGYVVGYNTATGASVTITVYNNSSGLDLFVNSSITAHIDYNFCLTT